MGPNEDEITDNDEPDNLADRMESSTAEHGPAPQEGLRPQPDKRLKKTLERLKRTCTACGGSGRRHGNQLEGVRRHRLAVEGLILREREGRGDYREIGVSRESEVGPFPLTLPAAAIRQ